jgi:hypothetical protein
MDPKNDIVMESTTGEGEAIVGWHNIFSIPEE